MFELQTPSASTPWWAEESAAALADPRVAAAGGVLVVQGDLPHLRATDVERCLDVGKH